MVGVHMDRRYLLLDRDGTLIVEKNYLSHPDQVELIPGVGEALVRVHELGWGIAVVSNQSGIGRGFYGWEDLRAVHDRVRTLLHEQGATLDGIYVCPHVPTDGCLCRKPSPGLVQQACEELGFRPSDALIVGDKACDLELGRNVGATTCLVRTGYGREYEQTHAQFADFIVDDISHVPALLLSLSGR